MGKKKREIEKNSVHHILESFKNNLYSILFFFNKFGDIAETEDEGAIKDFTDFVVELSKEYGGDKEKEGKKKMKKGELASFVRKLSKHPKLTIQNFNILSSSSFLMLNNYFEYLIAELLTYHYSKFKDKLSAKEFKVSLQDVNEYENIEEFEKHLIFKEVETMLIEKSFNSLLDHFRSNLKIDLSDNIVNWDIITECRERRHIIVHNGSIVNKKYLLRTNNPENKKVGDKLRISKEYFKTVFNEIKLAGLLLSYECWGSWDGSTATAAISNMMYESFECLNLNENNLCERLTSYAQKIESRDDQQEDLLLRIKFNKCISLKTLEKTSELMETLKTIKVGTASPLFKLAHAILSNKTDKTILEHFKQAQKIEEIDAVRYNEWPIFSFIRHKKRLNGQIEKILKI